MRKKPSAVNASAVSAGAVYRRKSIGPLSVTSPASPAPASLPSGRAIRISAPTTGLPTVRDSCSSPSYGVPIVIIGHSVMPYPCTIAHPSSRPAAVYSSGGIGAPPPDSSRNEGISLPACGCRCR